MCIFSFNEICYLPSRFARRGIILLYQLFQFIYLKIFKKICLAAAAAAAAVAGVELERSFTFGRESMRPRRRSKNFEIATPQVRVIFLLQDNLRNNTIARLQKKKDSGLRFTKVKTLLTLT